MPKTKGYAIKIEDSKGNEKKFFSSKAKTHEQGNALTSTLITHFGLTYPAYGRFSARSVEPSNGGVGYKDISHQMVGTLRWP